MGYKGTVKVDLIGRRFGRLLIVARAPHAHGKETRWLAVCDCGAPVDAVGAHLRRGATKSCGCLKRERIMAHSTTHGMAAASEHRVWSGMIQRCTNPRRRRYDRYGGRGINVCDRWRDSFAAFYADVGPRPSPTHSLDRFPDNDGNYEPGNVRWGTPSEQARNKSNTVLDADKVNEIRGRREHGERAASIALRLGVCETTVRLVLTRKAWADVP